MNFSTIDDELEVSLFRKIREKIANTSNIFKFPIFPRAPLKINTHNQ